MAAPRQTACSNWATADDLRGPCAGASPDDIELALSAATSVLFALTRFRWPGACDDVVRPCGERRSAQRVTWGWNTLGPEYGWWCTCNRSANCGCSTLSQIPLGAYPIVDVTEVKIDGDIVDPVEYRVDDYRWLVGLDRLDNGQRRRWPCCQDIGASSDEEDTFEVSFSYGVAPPPVAVTHAATLACELLTSQNPDADCRLPERVTSITRQGVSLAVIDPLTLFDDGRTGLPEVDLWLGSLNYGDKMRNAQVVVPETMRRSTRRIDT